MSSRVGAVLTCHNRKSLTLACLRALYDQRGLPRLPDVFLLDDASTDGTAAAVTSQHPEVTLLRGDGQRYWNGGMRLAFQRAARGDYDFYLWLNDDTLLDADAVARLLVAARSHGLAQEWSSVVVGTTVDPVTGDPTYGGLRRHSRLRPLRFEPVAPGADAQPVDTMNGNCVLIGRDVVRSVGVNDERFTHAMGDFDYALRARGAGFAVVLAPGTFGTCARNPTVSARTQTGGGLRRRWKQVTGPKGLPPRDWWRFTRRHAGVLAPLVWAKPYLTVLVRAAGWRRAQPSIMARGASQR